MAINFTLANGNFFYGLLGTLVEGGGGGPTYTHTYTEADTLPSFSVDNSVEMGTNDMVSAYLGCMVNTCTITSSVNETVKVSLDCFYKTETLGTSGVFTHVAETEGSFTFAQGTLEIPNGTAIATVQTFELTLTNNLEYIFGLASRFAATGLGKQREFNFRLTAAFNDVTKLLTYFLDGTNTATAPDAATPTPHATMELTFTNSGAGALLESIVLLFANVYFDEETLPQSVNEVIKEDITGHALSCTSVVWTNDSATVMALG